MPDNGEDQGSFVQRGRQFGHYRIEKKLGSGGMGDVYLATDLRLNRAVAIKTLRQKFFDDSDKSRRFSREAVTAAQVNHANIMSIYDIGSVELESGRSLDYIVMEYINGDSLENYITTSRPTTSELLRISEKIASALAAAHKLGIVHRDIKMGNIMIDSENEPKVLDFGLAKPFAGAFSGSSSADAGTDTVTSELTEERKIIGTVSYMSPEQARGDDVDHRSDIFSFGILLYNIFTQRLPFDGQDRVSTIAKILEASHEPIRSFDGSLPSELERIVGKCLQKDPNDRYQDTRDMVVDLRSLRRQYDSGISDSISDVRVHSEVRVRTSGMLSGLPAKVAFTVLAVVVLVVIWSVTDLTFIGSKSSGSTETEALAILNFENLSDSEDPNRYGRILQELILTDLSDNAPMRLISSQRLFDVQKQLGYRDRTKIDRDVSIEVAQKSGASIMLSGDLIKAGEQWIVTCKLVDVSDGTIVTSHRLEGADIFEIVDDLSGLVRKDFSKSASRAEIDLSVKVKSSVSMEAFRHYVAGVDFLNEGEYRSATEEFKQAIAIDPEFSNAYYKMAIAQWWMEDVESNSGKKSILSILENGHYSSERERIMATGALALMNNDYYEALQQYQSLTDSFPDDKEAWYGLGEALYHFGSDTRNQALPAFEAAINLDVGFILAYRHIFELYFHANQYKRAVERASDLIKVRPESPIGYRFLAASTVLLNDSARAEQAIEQALKHHEEPNELAALYLELYRSYEVAGRLNKAIEYVTRILRLNVDGSSTRTSDIWGSLIRMHEKLNQPELADSALDAALAGDIPVDAKLTIVSNTVQMHFATAESRARAHVILDKGLRLDTVGTHSSIWAAAGELAMADLNFAEAERCAKIALDRSPNNQNDWADNILFESYIHRGKYEEAYDLGEEWLDNHRGMSNGYLYVLQASVYSGRFDHADSLLSDALMADSTEFGRVFLLRNVAYMYRNMGEFRKSLDIYHRALQIAPDDERDQLVRAIGNVACVVGDFDLAVESHRELFESDSANPVTMRDLSTAYQRQGDFSESEMWLKRALAYDSTDAVTLRMFGYLYNVQGRYGDAVAYARSAFQKNRSFFSYNLLAWILVAGDIDIDGGIELAKYALENPPTRNLFRTYIKESAYVPLPEHTLGLAYMKRGDYTAALGYLEIAAELRPDNAEISKHLAACRDQSGT